MTSYLCDLKIEDDDDIRQCLIPRMKPTWANPQVEKLSGGFSHIMYLCYENGKKKDSVVVRIKNAFDGSPLQNCQFEYQVLQALVRKQLFPEVFAIFSNGYAYRYVEGQSVFQYSEDKPMIITDHVLRQIARRMRALHSLEVPKRYQNHPETFRRLKKVMISRFPEQLASPMAHLSIEDFKAEIKILEAQASKFDSKTVVCHGDCHSANMVHADRTGDVIFVDFEWTHVGCLAEDIGFFLQVLEINEMTFDMTILAPIDHETKFLKYYLEESNNNGKCETLTNDSVQSLKRQVSFFKLLCLFFVVILNISYPTLTSKLSNDPVSFLSRMFQLYLAQRKRMFPNVRSFPLFAKD